jgi:hypothetical protein
VCCTWFWKINELKSMKGISAHDMEFEVEAAPKIVVRISYS